MLFEFDTWSDEWMYDEDKPSGGFWNATLHIGDVVMTEPVATAKEFNTEQEAMDAAWKLYNRCNKDTD